MILQTHFSGEIRLLYAIRNMAHELRCVAAVVAAPAPGTRSRCPVSTVHCPPRNSSVVTLRIVASTLSVSLSLSLSPSPLTPPGCGPQLEFAFSSSWPNPPTRESARAQLNSSYNTAVHLAENRLQQLHFPEPDLPHAVFDGPVGQCNPAAVWKRTANIQIQGWAILNCSSVIVPPVHTAHHSTGPAASVQLPSSCSSRRCSMPS